MFDLQQLQYLREGNQLEAKEAAGGVPKSVWETYSAFANTNGGVILLGVSEDRQHQLIATGLRDPERIAKDFWDTVNNRNKVSVNVLDDEDVAVEQVGDASIVAVHVPRADREAKPIYVDRNPIGGTYRRNGEGDYKCSEEEYQAMVRDNGTGSIPLDHMPLARFDLEDLDSGTIAAYRNTLSAVRPGHPWLSLDMDEFLVRLGAAAKGDNGQNHPTRAGLLMFGHEWKIVQEFPYYFLDYREVSDGVRRWDHRIVSDDGEWGGNLYGFWLKTWPQIAQTIRRPFALDSSMRRVDDTPLHMALREALANTLIHADYYVRGNTVIIRDRDGISFANPGGLRIPPDVAVAGGLSDSRNPTLLKMFALISVVERAGSGFDAMRAGCGWAHVPFPNLTESFDPDRTQLTFKFSGSDTLEDNSKSYVTHRDEHGLSTTLTDNLPEEILDDQEVVLAYLREKQTNVTRVQVERLLGSSASKAKYILKQLVDGGYIQRQGRGRGVSYALKKGE
ncbi:putative DNA binding domain-containing protein [Bifidobacterium sp. 82T10]|uniref:DNA binding domain-containing protein n=1 Tax=Bifidobacterium miconis TaxID=2834435 RepID=A0ABS6WHA0_9BIFI|nr:RNA-binding domain-containing protein [Bifidobacterium miconis]MBW3093435.1 putative DNA binding domain-containing protein [Bifidobacterium miconis]